MPEESDMAALIIRLPDDKRERLKHLARARKQSVTKLFDEMATVLLAQYDAEKHFRARAARGAGRTKRGLRLLAKARGAGKPRGSR
jgi:predicted transcriptional regulator